MAAHKSSKAWGVAAKSEPRWPASLAVLIAAALNFALPARYSVGPSWLEGVLVVVILIPLTIAAPRRLPEEGRWQQLLAVVPIAIVNGGKLVIEMGPEPNLTLGADAAAIPPSLTAQQ